MVSPGAVQQSAANRSENGSIAACVVCRNEADKLGPCLDSVTWADELLVMDLQSQDASPALARRYGARVISRAPLPIVEPLRNELAAFASCDWILALDPDERVPPALAQLLRQLARRPDLDAVVMRRMNHDLGHPASHPIQRYEPQLRMYRPDKVRWPLAPNRLPAVPAARSYQIPARDELALIHERNRNVPEIVERIGRYAPAQAQAMLDEGEVFSAGAMFQALARQAEKEFLHAEPWRDGVPGLLRAGILVAYKFYVWTSFWQLSGAARTAEDERWVRRAGLFLRSLRWLVVWTRRLTGWRRRK